jgi:hypothetical protein
LPSTPVTTHSEDEHHLEQEEEEGASIYSSSYDESHYPRAPGQWRLVNGQWFNIWPMVNAERQGGLVPRGHCEDNELLDEHLEQEDQQEDDQQVDDPQVYLAQLEQLEQLRQDDELEYIDELEQRQQQEQQLELASANNDISLMIGLPAALSGLPPAVTRTTTKDEPTVPTTRLTTKAATTRQTSKKLASATQGNTYNKPISISQVDMQTTRLPAAARGAHTMDHNAHAVINNSKGPARLLTWHCTADEATNKEVLKSRMIMITAADDKLCDKMERCNDVSATASITLAAIKSLSAWVPAVSPVGPVSPEVLHHDAHITERQPVVGFSPERPRRLRQRLDFDKYANQPPIAAPTVAPTVAPTAAPTAAPIVAPTVAPTVAPSIRHLSANEKPTLNPWHDSGAPLVSADLITVPKRTVQQASPVTTVGFNNDVFPPKVPAVVYTRNSDSSARQLTSGKVSNSKTMTRQQQHLCTTAAGSQKQTTRVLPAPTAVVPASIHPAILEAVEYITNGASNNMCVSSAVLSDADMLETDDAIPADEVTKKAKGAKVDEEMTQYRREGGRSVGGRRGKNNTQKGTIVQSRRPSSLPAKRDYRGDAKYEDGAVRNVNQTPILSYFSFASHLPSIRQRCCS